MTHWLKMTFSVTPALIKRHPNRAVFLVTSQCAMYCRFCNRKRLVGKDWAPEAYRKESLRRIEEDPDIREIIISGGDPFMLPPTKSVLFCHSYETCLT